MTHNTLEEMDKESELNIIYVLLRDVYIVFNSCSVVSAK